MKRLLIVHPGTRGATAELATAVRDGATAAEPDATLSVVTRSALVCTPVEVLAADGYAFVSPERFGYMAGELKLFFDRTFYQVMADHDPEVGGGLDSRLAGRPYAIVVCAGQDGRGAASSIERIVTGWRLRAVTEPLLARRVGGQSGTTRGRLAAPDLSRAHAIGALLASGLATGIW